MLEKVAPYILTKDFPLYASGLFFLWAWSTFYRTSYIFFCLGVFSTLAVEGLWYWRHLRQKVLKQYGKNINIEIAKVEIQKFLGEEVPLNHYDVDRKNKKKRYYQNNKGRSFSKTTKNIESRSTNLSQSILEDLPLKRDKDSIDSSDKKIIVEQAGFSNKKINKLLMAKEKSSKNLMAKANNNNNNSGNASNSVINVENANSSPTKGELEERAQIISVGHRNFIDRLSQYLKVLDVIYTAEKIYGKSLRSMKEDREGLFSSIMSKPESSELDVGSDECMIDQMCQEDITFLIKKFGDTVTKRRKVVISGWNALRESLEIIGTLHLNCSIFVSQVSIATINMMSEEYHETYLKVKLHKKEIAKDYDEAYVAYFKLKNEYETIQNSLEAALDDYQRHYKKKETAEVILRDEMKARLLKSQLDSQRIKLVKATDSLKTMVLQVRQENDKLEDFIKDWNKRQGSVCQTVLRSVIACLEESAVDCERTFERMFENIEDLYDSFEEIDVDTESPSMRKRFMVVDEEVDVLDKMALKRSVMDRSSPSRQSVGMARSQGNSPNNSPKSRVGSPERLRVSFVEVDRVVKEFKEQVKWYADQYELESKKYEIEVKRSKEILEMVEPLSGFTEEYMKEKMKVISYNSLDLDIPNLNVYWSIVYENLKMTSDLSTQLYKKLTLIYKTYVEGIENCRREYKNSQTLANNAITRGNTFISGLERDVTSRSIGAKVKSWFSKVTENEPQEPLVESATLDKLFGIEFANTPFISDQERIMQERQYLKNDFDIGLMQIRNAVKSFERAAVNLRKDIVLAYLQCYSNQKDLLFSLVKEIDKINHFTENFETQLNEIIQGYDELEEQETLKRRHKDSIFTPIKINNIENLGLDEQLDPIWEEESPMDGEPEIELEHVLKGIDINFVNKLFKVFGKEWSKSTYFKQKMMKTLYTTFNKKKAKLIRQIKILDFVLGDQMPEVRSVTVLPSDPCEFLCDFEIAFQGNIMFGIQVQFEHQYILNMINKDRPMYIEAKVLIKSITGKVRICYVPTELGTSWFSFVGTPILELSVEPKIGQTTFDLSAYPHLTGILKDVIDARLQKMTYPYRKELDLPMSFKPEKVVPPSDERDFEYDY